MSRRTRKGDPRNGNGPGRTHGIALLLEGVPDGSATGSKAGTPRLDAMLSMVRAGQSPRQAALGVGVSPQTWWRWMQECGVDPAGPAGWTATAERLPREMRDFWDAVQRARAQYLARLTASVTSGIPRNPALGVKLLRQADPDNPDWRIDEDPAPAPPWGQPAARVVERQVILLPEARMRELLREGLAGELADAGEAEDDDPDSEELGPLAEVIVPPGARRK